MNLSFFKFKIFQELSVISYNHVKKINHDYNTWVKLNFSPKPKSDSINVYDILKIYIIIYNIIAIVVEILLI